VKAGEEKNEKECLKVRTINPLQDSESEEEGAGKKIHTQFPQPKHHRHHRSSSKLEHYKLWTPERNPSYKHLTRTEPNSTNGPLSKSTYCTNTTPSTTHNNNNPNTNTQNQTHHNIISSYQIPSNLPPPTLASSLPFPAIPALSPNHPQNNYHTHTQNHYFNPSAPNEGKNSHCNSINCAGCVNCVHSIPAIACAQNNQKFMTPMKVNKKGNTYGSNKVPYSEGRRGKSFLLHNGSANYHPHQNLYYSKWENTIKEANINMNVPAYLTNYVDAKEKKERLRTASGIQSLGQAATEDDAKEQDFGGFSGLIGMSGSSAGIGGNVMPTVILCEEDSPLRNYSKIKDEKYGYNTRNSLKGIVSITSYKKWLAHQKRGNSIATYRKNRVCFINISLF